jgi:hypothetical protein
VLRGQHPVTVVDPHQAELVVERESDPEPVVLTIHHGDVLAAGRLEHLARVGEWRARLDAFAGALEALVPARADQKTGDEDAGEGDDDLPLRIESPGTTARA